MGYIKWMLRIFIACLFLCIPFGCVGKESPALTGREMVLEIECPNNPEKSGIYLWDPVEDKQPRIWLVGGHRPVWSRDRKSLAYEHKGLIMVRFLDDPNPYMVCSLGCVDKDDGAPLLELNENQGVIFHNRVDPGVDMDLVCKWDVFKNDLKSPFGYSSAMMFIRGPLVPFFGDRSAPSDAKSFLEYWEKVRVARKVSFEPGEHRAAVEQGKAAPTSMSGHRNKVYIYDTKTFTDTEYPDPVMDQFHIDHDNDGRRLTQLAEDIQEMNPLWSPDGKWIAFTIYDSKNMRLDVAVCKPDGSDLQILTRNFNSLYGVTFSQGELWKSLADKSPPDKPLSYSTLHQFGVSDIRAVEWSSDSSYLLLVSGYGNRYSTAAKIENDGWKFRPTNRDLFAMNYTSSRRRCFLGQLDKKQYVVSLYEHFRSGMSHIMIDDLESDPREYDVHTPSFTLLTSANERIIWADW